MFSSALKSFNSNILFNYVIAPQPNSISGPWKVFDAKRKGSGKAASVFVFDKKSLEPSGGGLGGRSSSTSVKAAQNEVIERLKKEASSLARLRHPNILELAEPVEETRNGGLMFATEPITAFLSGLLVEKDQGESSGGSDGRTKRYVVDEVDGTKKSRQLEIDELEIQRGLLQLAKGLEFLHESAGLVHANLTPDAIAVNVKGDWKITGLAFTGPASDSDKPTSVTPISLSELLNHDPRLPASVQLSLDYTSPDFVLDNNLTSSADMFSLGLLVVSLYNTPHRSPLETHGSLSSYKRIFSSSSTVPSKQNNFLATGKMPPNLASDLLPRLITRRPAQRLTARDFQQAQYFDNILVSTLRFMEALPAKTQSEKTQFMRGLPRIMPQFPSSVLERKLLPVLLDEMKDRDLLAPIMQNVFAIIKALPAGKPAFTETVVPKLRDVFLEPAANKSGSTPKDTSKEAGLMVILENMAIVAANTSGKEFRDDILPIIAVGLASPTHGVVDASLSTLSHITPKLDYSTIKNELFPVIAGVFAHTNSLGIKIQGLEAFYTLCGGTEGEEAVIGDGLDGTVTRHNGDRTKSSAVLDKFTIQEKIVPLLKGIKTKEPGVMMAALKVLRQVGKVADTDFLAMEVLPIMWTFSLGPLLDLTQFQAFMSLIKSLSARIEREHTQKLREVSTSSGTSSLRAGKPASRADTPALHTANGGEEVDFEALVTGRNNANGRSDMIDDWDAPSTREAVARGVSQGQTSNPSSSWSSAANPRSTNARNATLNSLRPSASDNRSVTPDQSLNAFSALQPSSPFSQPLQPTSTGFSGTTASLPLRSTAQNQNSASVNWGAAIKPSTNAWATNAAVPSAQTPSYSIAPPPLSPPVQGAQVHHVGSALGTSAYTQKPAPNGPNRVQQQNNGLDKYESLI